MLGVVLVVAAVLLLTGLPTTLAQWTDEGRLDTGSLSAGGMDLRLAAEGRATGAVGLGTAYPADAVTFSGLSPGEQRAFDLSVGNVGAPPMTWTATVARGRTWTFAGSPVTVQLFAGSRRAVDDTYPVVETCSGPAVGDLRPVAATSQSLLTTARRVAAGGTDAVCAVVGLAADATNAEQGGSGTLALTFAAAQSVS